MEKLNSLGETIVATGPDIKLDGWIKRALSEKSIIAWILAYTAEEFKGMKPKDIVRYIEDPSVSAIPVMPGSTNASGMIEGGPQESKIPGEGLTLYDIRFAARSPKGGKTPAEYRLIINFEAQGRPNETYYFETRGIVYCGRLLSEQLGRNVTDGHYENIQKVYSIWIIMNCPRESANTIYQTRLVNEPLAGSFNYSPRIDIERVVTIRLPKDDALDKAKNKPTRLHEMLSTLLSGDLGTEEKLGSLDKNFDIPVTATLREEVENMCNYSSVIRDEAFIDGENSNKEASARRLIRMNKLSDEDIAEAVDLSVSRVKQLREEENNLVTV